MGFGRRRFLAMGFGGCAVAFGGLGPTTAGAAEPTVPVWRLSADWGFAVGPKGRTRCRCSACRAHAANAVFATRPGALGDRIHPCCVCQPVAMHLLADDVALLFPGGMGKFDLRYGTNRLDFEAAVARAGAIGIEVVPTEAELAVAAASPSTPTADPAPIAPAPTRPLPSHHDAGSVLPSTGSSTSALIVGAAVAVGLGSLVAAAGRPAVDGPETPAS